MCDGCVFHVLSGGSGGLWTPWGKSVCLAPFFTCVLGIVLNSKAFKHGPVIVLEITVLFPIFGNSALARMRCVCVCVTERTCVWVRNTEMADRGMAFLLLLLQAILLKNRK